ncbi:MAG: DUF5652 family protein [Patescibacteria group bacterium]|jgi:methionyl-tRNA synthetase
MEQFITTYPWIIWLAIIWTLPWKGVALWKAARVDHLGWFIALMVINTLGLLEIIYIFAVNLKAKK